MAEIVNRPLRWQLRRFSEIANIPEGKALFISWNELDAYSDGAHFVRVQAYNWGKRLGLKFSTIKGPAGMYIVKASTTTIKQSPPEPSSLIKIKMRTNI